VSVPSEAGGSGDEDDGAALSAEVDRSEDVVPPEQETSTSTPAIAEAATRIEARRERVGAITCDSVGGSSDGLVGVVGGV